ncbi:hypothetical protein [Cereibacter sphaeroides]|uniref:hypothetical protein n=1 Tax=Cereibacter sphaeroides TaxID=1063 RepID=UPI000F542449|nr:hypothetical protein [Cereibacter sphaeroides]
MSLDVNQANEGLRANARGGIAAVITVNSGALIALLSQLGPLKDMVEMSEVKRAFEYWIAGVVAGLLCWFFVTLAAGAHVNGMRKAEIWTTGFGYLAWLLSTIFFALGAVRVLVSLK